MTEPYAFFEEGHSNKNIWDQFLTQKPAAGVGASPFGTWPDKK